MREIKFRAKRIDDGRWVYGQYFKAPLTDENSGAQPESGWFFLSGSETYHCIVQDNVSFVIDVDTLGQFTGLKDKNGREVYEGDVAIAWSEGRKATCEIKWGQGRVGFFLYRSPHVIWNLSGGGFDYTFEMIEVIGNKYDNPELLPM